MPVINKDKELDKVHYIYQLSGKLEYEVSYRLFRKLCLDNNNEVSLENINNGFYYSHRGVKFYFYLNKINQEVARDYPLIKKVFGGSFEETAYTRANRPGHYRWMIEKAMESKVKNESA